MFFTLLDIVGESKKILSRAELCGLSNMLTTDITHTRHTPTLYVGIAVYSARHDEDCSCWFPPRLPWMQLWHTSLRMQECLHRQCGQWFWQICAFALGWQDEPFSTRSSRGRNRWLSHLFHGVGITPWSTCTQAWWCAAEDYRSLSSWFWKQEHEGTVSLQLWVRICRNCRWSGRTFARNGTDNLAH